MLAPEPNDCSNCKNHKSSKNCPSGFVFEFHLGDALLPPAIFRCIGFLVDVTIVVVVLASTQNVQLAQLIVNEKGVMRRLKNVEVDQHDLVVAMHDHMPGAVTVKKANQVGPTQVIGKSPVAFCHVIGVEMLR